MKKFIPILILVISIIFILVIGNMIYKNSNQLSSKTNKFSNYYTSSYYSWKGYFKYKAGYYHKAIEYYNIVIEYNSSLYKGYVNRGSCYFILKEYTQAFENYNKVIELYQF